MKLEISIQCIERLFCAFTMIIFVPKLYSNIIKKEKKNTRSFSMSLIKESQILGKEFIKSRQIFWKSGYHAFVYFLFPSASTDQKTQQPQNNINNIKKKKYWKVILYCCPMHCCRHLPMKALWNRRTHSVTWSR